MLTIIPAVFDVQPKNARSEFSSVSRGLKEQNRALFAFWSKEEIVCLDIKDDG